MISFLYGSDVHHLDHLAPLSSILQIPLLVTDYQVFQLTKQYYPNLNLIFDKFTFSDKLSKFETIFSTLPLQILRVILLDIDFNAIWVPHGHSDKNLEGLDASHLLVYGDIMKKRIERLLPHANVTTVGNFRAEFYKRSEKYKIETKNKKMLFAPSWESSPQDILNSIYKYLPKDITLLVKPHPNTFKREALSTYNLPNVTILDEYPPVHKIMKSVDYLLATNSSITYDFLYYNKPIFFLTPENTPIRKCGQLVSPSTLFQSLDKVDLSLQRSSLLKKVFDDVSLEELKNLCYR